MATPAKHIQRHVRHLNNPRLVLHEEPRIALDAVELEELLAQADIPESSKKDIKRVEITGSYCGRMVYGNGAGDYVYLDEKHGVSRFTHSLIGDIRTGEELDREERNKCSFYAREIAPKLLYRKHNRF